MGEAKRRRNQHAREVQARAVQRDLEALAPKVPRRSSLAVAISYALYS